jgi:hypothetical protein
VPAGPSRRPGPGRAGCAGQVDRHPLAVRR